MNRVRVKYNWIPVLMIVSQVLLAGFLVYWLHRQYQSEKDELKENLLADYRAVYEQQLDTLIMETIITPTLKDTAKYKFFFNYMKPELHKRDSLRFDILIGNDSMSPSFISKDSIRIIGYGQQTEVLDSFLHDSVLQISKTRDQIMVKSVKMFVSQTEESFKSGKLEQLFQLPLDSLHFISDFKDLLAENHKKLSVKYINDKAVSKDRSMVLSVNTLSPELLVTKYRVFLLKKVSPQMLFALFLLCLSSVALYLAWASLKKQLSLNSLRNDFVANISHELKTPVATVKIALEAIQSFYLENDRETTLDYLGMASKEVDRLENLVDKVLQHSVLEDTTLILQKQEINPGELTKELLQKMKALFIRFNARVEIENENYNTIIEADPVYIEAVLRNLLDNAMKYAGPEPVIRISLSESDKSIILRIEDEGPGIPEKYITQVFDKFFRVPTGDRHDVKGYGLGLNFAQQVMSSHGGTIRAENKTKGGCAFSLIFPRYKDEN